MFEEGREKGSYSVCVCVCVVSTGAAGSAYVYGLGRVVCVLQCSCLPPHCPIPPSTFSRSLLLTMGVTLATDDWHRWVMITCIKSSSLRQ